MRIELSDVYDSGRAVLCKQANKLYFRATAHEKKRSEYSREKYFSQLTKFGGNVG